MKDDFELDEQALQDLMDPRVPLPAQYRKQPENKFPSKAARDEPPETEDAGEWYENRMSELQARQSEIDRIVEDAEHPDDRIADEVRKMAGLGYPAENIADLLRMGVNDLYEHYERDFRLGNSQVTSEVAANFIRIATKSDDKVAVKAALEILSRRGGPNWKPPTQKIEMSGEGSKARIVPSATLTWEDRQTLRALIEGAIKKRGLGLAAGQSEDAQLIEHKDGDSE